MKNAGVEITAYGNVKSSASDLYGLAVEDMDETDLTYQDNDYQQIITAVAKKAILKYDVKSS